LPDALDPILRAGRPVVTVWTRTFEAILGAVSLELSVADRRFLSRFMPRPDPYTLQRPDEDDDASVLPRRRLIAGSARPIALRTPVTCACIAWWPQARSGELLIWKFLHIACMFGAVTIIAGSGLVTGRVLRGGNVPAIRRVLAAERRLTNLVGAPLLVAGIVFGFIAALTGGFDLTAQWLILAYVLVAVNFVNGIGFYDPHAKRLAAAAEASVETTPSAELRALIESPRTWIVPGLDLVLWVAIIFVMVMKPSPF
jgi:uncharacterized membrane protein